MCVRIIFLLRCRSRCTLSSLDSCVVDPRKGSGSARVRLRKVLHNLQLATQTFCSYFFIMRRHESPQCTGSTRRLQQLTVNHTSRHASSSSNSRFSGRVRNEDGDPLIGSWEYGDYARGLGQTCTPHLQDGGGPRVRNASGAALGGRQAWSTFLELRPDQD